MRRSDYISQDGLDYACCQLLALLNACVYWGRDIDAMRPGTDEFERLVDLSGCRHGSCISPGKVADELGIQRFPIRPVSAVRNIDPPIELPIRTEWWGFHATLMIGNDRRFITLANYEPGSAVSRVSYSALRFYPRGNINRRATKFYPPLKETIQ